MQHWQRTVGWLVMIVALFVGLGACASSEPPAPEIRIGYIGPMTGEMAEMSGRTTLNGIRLAVEQVNAAGGLEIAGQKHPITLLTEDDANNPERAVAHALKLINQDDVVAIVGVPFSSSAIPVADVAETARIPFISSSSTNPRTTAGKRYAFRIAFIDPFQGRMMATFAHEDLGVTRAAVLFDVASDYNRGVAEVFRSAFEELGGTVVAFESYTSDQNQDFTPQLTRIQESGAEVLLLPNFPNDVRLQVTQGRELGLEMVLLGTDGWSPAEFAPDPLFEGSYLSQMWSPEVETTKTPAFVEAYRAMYQEDPNENAAISYDMMQILFETMQRQGSAEPEAIREGLALPRRYEGVAGVMEFDGSGDPARSGVIVKLEGGKAIFHEVVEP